MDTAEPPALHIGLRVQGACEGTPTPALLCAAPRLWPAGVHIKQDTRAETAKPVRCQGGRGLKGRQSVGPVPGTPALPALRVLSLGAWVTSWGGRGSQEADKEPAPGQPGGPAAVEAGGRHGTAVSATWRQSQDPGRHDVDAAPAVWV